MDKLSYSIEVEPTGTHSVLISGIHSVLVFVYELIDDLNECYHSYLMIFHKYTDSYVCYQPRVPPYVKQWLIDTKVIKLQKGKVVLSPKSLLQIL